MTEWLVQDSDSRPCNGSKPNAWTYWPMMLDRKTYIHVDTKYEVEDYFNLKGSMSYYGGVTF